MIEAPITPDQLQISPLRQQVTALLRQAIVSSQLEPGQRLVERELMEWTGVSRGTIRESIRDLTVEGLVSSIPQKGAFVASLTREAATELYEVRAMLEGRAARQFAERATDDQVRRLRDSLENLKRVVAADDDTKARLAAKSIFYGVLFAGAANPTIEEILGGLQARVTVLRATSMSQPGRPKAMVEEIAAIVEAVERRDAAGAEKACNEHVLNAGRTALEALKTNTSIGVD